MQWHRRRFITTSAGALAGLSLAGCRSESGGEADTEIIVFRGGVVLPVDDGFSEHTALAIQGNRVLAVGSDEAVARVAGSGARTIDLEGRTILPGFIEPHMHFGLLAAFGQAEDVGPFIRSTFDASLEGIRAARDRNGSTGWIVARQFDPVLLEPPRELTTRELDEISSDRPIFVLNASGHIAYVNSKALELAGITQDTPDPQGARASRECDISCSAIFRTALPVPILGA